MGVKCLAQEHNTVPRPGLEPGPFDPESSVLTIRPPHLPHNLLGSKPNCKKYFLLLIKAKSVCLLSFFLSFFLSLFVFFCYCVNLKWPMYSF